VLALVVGVAAYALAGPLAIHTGDDHLRDFFVGCGAWLVVALPLYRGLRNRRTTDLIGAGTVLLTAVCLLASILGLIGLSALVSRVLFAVVLAGVVYSIVTVSVVSVGPRAGA
jgi:hypothetical protein